ncbi:ABC1 kinase family protein [Pseudonocardia oroxyli]|uniref:Predicted unusual protein kinase regulating ubiquinone biosynthesis, AarF/ABC1/UbiB family n=1 Tax=Pseudonocardia oroxyli TaxID=366584 RepID=A0A1G7WD84_PSEOR|nr:AarF/ABC1/UbiB kinase family protein [Pseudonocardia oroxyli]SDG69913.1 Predicted unusual protein kinase regulating ubiquinone biosynthesis, AarF/ABC1/UbiB family [Pseudonocardia oroxyli]
MDGVPRFGRSARLASLPLSFAGRAVGDWGRTLVGAEADSAQTLARNADQLFAVLGTLKGGAMKLGQALSVYEAMIPTEIAGPYREALAKLQTSSPPMPTADMHRMLAEQLGRGWRAHFREFADEPTAAASVGQVHRATWKDGREVAVKIQYPGADLALDADLRTLERFSRLFAAIFPALDARALIRELRARTMEEVDYRMEADRQRAFAAGFADWPGLRVPRVIASAPKVLVSEWLDGAPLRESLGGKGSVADRDRYGTTIVETMFASPTRVGLLHADPHPGNFLVLADGSGLGMIDFGAAATLPDGIPPVLVAILRLTADRDAEALDALLRAEGFLAPGAEAADVLRWVGALGDPLREESFHFTEEWIARQGARVANPTNRAYRETGRALSFPPEYALVMRVLSGWMNILAQLDCTVAARGLVERWVPGFR